MLELSAAPWLTARAAGVVAFLALTLDVTFGLLVSTGAADRWIPRASSVQAHRWLSLAALLLTAVHALALLADDVVHFGLVDLLVPFASSYRVFAVALGVLAAHGALLVHASFFWRRRIGAATWRRIHFLSFFVFAGALLHGLFTGSDSSTVGMRLLYLAAAGVVGVLAALRLRARVA